MYHPLRLMGHRTFCISPWGNKFYNLSLGHVERGERSYCHLYQNETQYVHDEDTIYSQTLTWDHAVSVQVSKSHQFISLTVSDSSQNNIDRIYQ
ncbi:hypothetical protein P280DRAFT_13110 [Massarina eburnea CBS 473.64]|uniref:Uncharacterized protein n=1 Tax=Massarina eburnea CBS 473.64 TaxID=1395130 RepID=A0A6A6SIN9_9PLEO|nr:hypothetical protein P280DRAFT_13110 [Massarina eburnea CBS 473.64]